MTEPIMEPSIPLNCVGQGCGVLVAYIGTMHKDYALLPVLCVECAVQEWQRNLAERMALRAYPVRSFQRKF